MELVLIRHGIAEDREQWQGQNDWLRPLTNEGRDKLKLLSGVYAKMISPVDVLVHSPLLRAQQTAEILLKSIKAKYTLESEVLAPDSNPTEFVKWVQDYPKAEKVVCVGHEPNLSQIASSLLMGSGRLNIQFKKAGAMSLYFSDVIKEKSARLDWLVTPKIILQ